MGPDEGQIEGRGEGRGEEGCLAKCIANRKEKSCLISFVFAVSVSSPHNLGSAAHSHASQPDQHNTGEGGGRDATFGLP